MQFSTKAETILSKKTGRSYAMLRADLAPIGAQSTAQIARVCSEPEVYKLFAALFKGRAYVEKDAAFFVNHVLGGWKNGTNFHWMILSGGEVVGTVGIKSMDGEFGYWQSAAHPGVMSQAVAILCERAREAGLPGLWAYVRRDNTASIRVLEKCGFLKDAELTAKREDAFGFRKRFEG